MFAFCIISCSSKDDGEIDIPASFEISESYLVHELGLEAAVLTIPVETELDSKSWDVTSDTEWCKAGKSMKGNSITVVVEANEEARSRKAIVKVTSTVKNYEIQVNQLGHGGKPYIVYHEPGQRGQYAL